MAFVEFLRVRNALKIFAIIVACIVLSVDFSIWYGIQHSHGLHHHFHGTLQESDSSPQQITSLSDLHFDIPLSIILGTAGFAAMIFATIVTTSFNRENGRGGFAFTKPISRERLGLTYIGIDLAAMATAFAFVVALGFVSLAFFGIAGKVRIDPLAFDIAADGFGAAFMWYALLQAVTAMRVSGGGLILGLSWPFFLLALGMYNFDLFGPIFHAAVAAVDLLNPLAYFGFSSHSDENVQLTNIFGFSPATCIAITWSVAVAACGVAIAGWKRLEV
jgi:hypothetical protein